jgi:hypothetical protein
MRNSLVVIAGVDGRTPYLYVRAALRDRQSNMLSIGSADGSGASEFAWIGWLEPTPSPTGKSSPLCRMPFFYGICQPRLRIDHACAY